jgi:type IV pilus assembly protein PilZ
MDDRRHHTRVPVSLKVAYRSKGDLQKDLVIDLSPGGLFVRTSKPLPIGTDVDLEVSLEESDAPIHIRGKVIWLRQRHGPEGMGIQFTGVMGPVLAELVEKK